MKSGKPLKKADKELFILIERKIKEKIISLRLMRKKEARRETYPIWMFLTS